MVICPFFSATPVGCDRETPCLFFWFVIIMKALCKMLFAIVDGGLLSGFSMKSRHSV